MLRLAELARIHGTDKLGHGYVEVYERLLGSRKIEALLEIGLGGGASIRTWLDYLPHTEVYCIEYFSEENKEKWGGASGSIPGAVVIPGSSTQADTWERVPIDIDVIIDDGSHFPEDQIKTFVLGFPHLKSGGLWFIEDTHCSFEEIYGYKSGEGALFNWLFVSMLTKQGVALKVGDDYQHIKNIRGFQMYKSLIVVEKA
jgi:hypothetical protein